MEASPGRFANITQMIHLYFSKKPPYSKPIAGLSLRRKTALILIVFFASPAFGAEWFVSPEGNDAAEGRTPETAWRSLQKGADVLGPGDTLTLLPGEYFQQMSLKANGSAEAPITIRASRPGFSMMRGHDRVTGFEHVPGSRFLWSAKVPAPVFSVFERDTKMLLFRAPSLADMDQFRGSFLFDADTGMLYVHRSDGAPPDGLINATYLSGYGILINGSYITVDGLVLAGFAPKDRENSGHAFGICLRGHHNTVRNSSFFSNGGGIDLRGEDCLIENNRLEKNDDPGYNELAQIYGTGSVRAKVLNNTILNGFTHGLRFYAKSLDGIARGNIIKNTRIGLYYKSSGGNRVAKNNVLIGSSYFNWGSGGNEGPMDEDFNTIEQHASWSEHNQPEPGGHTLLFDKGGERDAQFCDPFHLDYRLQSDSPYRGKAADGGDLGAYPFRGDVLFVDPSGDDTKEGFSVASAFKTLTHALNQAKPGMTIYLSPGVYHEQVKTSLSGTADRPITIRGRGARHGVTITPDSKESPSILLTDASHLRLENLILTHGLKLEGGKDLHLDHCILRNTSTALALGNTSGFRLRRSTVASTSGSAVAVGNSCRDVRLTGSLFESGKAPAIAAAKLNRQELFSEYNNYHPKANQPLMILQDESAGDLDTLRKLTGNDRNSISKASLRNKDGLTLPPRSPCVAAGEQMGNIGGLATLPPAHSPDSGIADAKMREITPWSASLTWWTPFHSSFGTRIKGGWWTARAYHTELHYGTTPACEKMIPSLGDLYHRVSIFDLKPGTTYYSKIVLLDQPRYDVIADPYEGNNRNSKVLFETPLSQWTTPEAENWKPRNRTLYAAPDGSAKATGENRDEPLSLTAASEAARAGDTILLLDGVYHEMFAPVATGVPKAPITLKALHPGKVCLDGSTFTRPAAVALFGKQYLVIDGLITRRFSDAALGCRAGMMDSHYYLDRGGPIEIRNAVVNGYGGYTHGVTARGTGKVELLNNVFLGFMTSVGGQGEAMVLNGNTWYVPSIRAFMFRGGPVVVKNNLFYGQNPPKIATQPMVSAWPVTVSDYNAFYFGPENLLSIIGYGMDRESAKGERVANVQKVLQLDLHSLEPSPKEVAFAGPVPRQYLDDEAMQKFRQQSASGEILPTLDWFNLPEGSRLNHAGEGGVPMGARAGKPLPPPFQSGQEVPPVQEDKKAAAK